MDLDSLKAKLKQELHETKVRLEERETYQKLKEYWDNLNSTQKKISLIVISILILMLLSLPIYSRYMDSQDLISEFESKRDLIRTLMLTQKELAEVSGPTSQINLDYIKSRIQSEVLQDGLLPDQNGGLNEFSDYKNSTIFPEQIIQAGLELSLKQITIRQLVQIATRIEAISDQIKIRDMIVRADNENKGYISATLKILLFKVSDPNIASRTTPTPEPPKRGRR